MGPTFDTDSQCLKPKITGLHQKGVRGDILTSTLALPASWAEVEGSNGGPSNFLFYTIKIRNLVRGSQVWHRFSGLKCQGNGVTSRSWWRGHPEEHISTSRLLGRGRGLEQWTSELWFLFYIKHEIWPRGPKFDTDSRGLKPKSTGLPIVGVRGDTQTMTLALRACWAEVEGSNGGPSNFPFYTIKIRNLACGSKVWHRFSGLKSQGNGVTPSRR